MKNRMILIVFFCAFGLNFQSNAAKNEQEKTIELLLKEKQYETAKKYINNLMPTAQNKSYLLFQLSKIEINCANLDEAFKSFQKSIELLDNNSKIIKTEESVEQLLDIVALLRQRQSYLVASCILNTLEKKYPSNPSVQYAIANLNIVQKKFELFFNHFYKAYLVSPSNPRRLPGLAMIESLKSSSQHFKDFYWLKAAEYYYDNTKMWQNVISMIYINNLNMDENVIDTFAKSLSEKIRPIFYYYFYLASSQSHKAEEYILSMKSYVDSDVRYNLFYRKLLITCGKKKLALVNFPDLPEENDEKFYYYDWWMSFAQAIAWSDNLYKYFDGYLIAFKQTSQGLLSKSEINRCTNFLLINWAHNLSRKWNPEIGITLLEKHYKELDGEAIKTLIGLNLSASQYDCAINTFFKSDKSTLGKNYDGLLRTMIKYYLFAGSSREHFESNVPTDVLEKYKDSIENKENFQKVRLKVPGHFFVGDNNEWFQWESLGPCVQGSAYSVMNFWKKDLSIGQIRKSINELLQNANLSADDSLLMLFENENMSVIPLVPSSLAIRDLIDMGIPALVRDSQLIKGVRMGHLRVIYGYDDQLKTFFLKDSLGSIGESCVGYKDIIKAEKIFVVLPKSSKKLPAVRKQLLVKSTESRILNDNEIEKLTEFDSNLKFWAFCHNGDAELKAGNSKCIEWYQKCLNSYPSKKTYIYEKLAEASGLFGQIDSVIEYSKLGLKEDPDNLKLLKNYVKAKLEKEKFRTNQDYVDELFLFVNKMKNVNPDYPFTYVLQADLHIRKIKTSHREAQFALNSINKFIEKYNSMNESWKNKSKPLMNHMLLTRKMCIEFLEKYTTSN